MVFVGAAKMLAKFTVASITECTLSTSKSMEKGMHCIQGACQLFEWSRDHKQQQQQQQQQQQPHPTPF